MAYDNVLGESPIFLSDDLAIYSGTATDGEGITDQIGNVQRGSLYISTDGSFYVKREATSAANAWYEISQAGQPEPEEESYATTITLTPSLIQDLTKGLAATTTITPAIPVKEFPKSAGVSLGASVVVNKLLEAETKSVTITLGADVVYTHNPA